MRWLLLFGVLGVQYPSSQAPEMALSAVLNEQKQIIEITLRNTGSRTYFVTMGAHLGRWCSTGFELFLQGKSVPNGRLLPDCGELEDQPGVIGGRLDSWVVLMPGGASYEMTFPFRSVRPMRGLHVSLADLVKSSWTVRARFRGTLDENYVLEWQSYHNRTDTQYLWNKKVPFWTGIVETTVSHHQSIRRRLKRRRQPEMADPTSSVHASLSWLCTY